MHRFFCLLVFLAVSCVPVRAAAADQYKWRHRKVWGLIDSGKWAEAVQKLDPILVRHPNDLEAMYLLAVAHANLDQSDRALWYAKKAILAGMPATRFIVGPRVWTAPLVRHEKFAALLGERPPGIVHGPMLGCIAATGARVWVRTAEEAGVTIRYCKADLGRAGRQQARTAEGHTKAGTDFTATIALTGLEPDTQYLYAAGMAGEAVPPASDWKTFRTAPATDAGSAFTIAFGGGAGYTPQNERMWDVIRARKPRALLLLGDNVYIDMPKNPNVQRYCYYRRQSRPEWQRLVAAIPVYTIYDDHDFGVNDCVPGHETFEPAWKPKVWEVFTENWVNPGYGGGPKQPGCWYDFTIGDVHFIMLDGRYYRSLKKKSMLGPVQLQWLLDTLKTSRKTFKVLASPVPWAKGTKGRSRDTWDGFPQEREQIFSFLEKNRIEGVVVLSADRHRSDAWKIERPAGYDLYEFESSRLTNVHSHSPMKKALFSYNRKQSFGLIDFDTVAADPTLTYRIVNIDGKEVYKLTLTGSQLARR